SAGRGSTRTRYAGIAVEDQLTLELEQEHIECGMPGRDGISGSADLGARGTGERGDGPGVGIFSAAGDPAGVVAVIAVGQCDEVSRAAQGAQDDSELGAEDTGANLSCVAPERIALYVAPSICV